MNQADTALEFMEQHGSLTSLEALMHLGIISFPKRICELEKRGYEFDKKSEVVIKANGEKAIIKRYFLLDKENDNGHRRDS